MGGTGVEEGWGRVDEESLRREVVGLDGAVDVVGVNTDSDTHDEMLWTLRRATIDFQKI